MKKMAIAVLMTLPLYTMAADSSVKSVNFDGLYVIGCDPVSMTTEIDKKEDLFSIDNKNYFDSSMYVSENKNESYNPDNIGKTIKRLYYRTKDASAAKFFAKKCKISKFTKETISFEAIEVERDLEDSNDTGGTLVPTFIDKM